MNTFKSFEEILYSINESNFDDIALQLFKYQSKENSIYKDYITNLGVNPDNVGALEEIPFMPIAFFKTHKVVTGDWKEQTTFESSRTTGAMPSKHFIKDVGFYLEVSQKIFESYYGDLRDCHLLALLPSYLERKGSSLIQMIHHFINLTGSPYSSFYLHDHKLLQSTLEKLIAKADGKKIVLWGVSFALIELAEKSIDLSNVMVMETGGMKGRRREITRQELHTSLASAFNTPAIHSEYGMTELLSQAYAPAGGYFSCPPWMKILVRDINDPFDMSKTDKSGGINVIDLANIYTCAFVETQDLGKVHQGGNFEVLGRIDNSDIRGCNLLV